MLKVDTNGIVWSSEEKNPTKLSRFKDKLVKKFLQIQINSFFNIFKKKDNLINIEREKEQEEARLIRDDLIPNSLEYFLNKRMNEDNDDSSSLDEYILNKNFI